MKILLWPHDTLKKVSEPVTQANKPDHDFIEEMFRTMKAAGGVGLSAIQVGVPLRIFILSTGHGRDVMVNPRLVWKSQEMERVREGCLSVPDQYDWVNRHTEVEVEYETLESAGKKVSGWVPVLDENDKEIGRKDMTMNAYMEILKTGGLRAQAIQHEIEHLDGKMFVDHLTSASRSRIFGNMMKYKLRGGK